MSEIKEIYVTGEAKIDAILQRIAARLDEIEGFNPTGVSIGDGMVKVVDSNGTAIHQFGDDA